MLETYKIEAIAIGNGTASRETEEFLKQHTFRQDIQIFVVSEQGASIYSASKIAREEFPDYDVTVRGAVSIARRLMDPLAELVKIDPKSIGVGQYQHDVDQSKLKKSLDQTVESCVNLVGVNLNTASTHLLTYIDDHPGITGSELARMWGRTKGAISQQIKKLVSRGLVVRKKQSNNAKTILLYVSEKGKEVSFAHKMHDMQDIAQTLAFLLSTCSLDEIAAFYKVMRSYISILDEN